MRLSQHWRRSAPCPLRFGSWLRRENTCHFYNTVLRLNDFYRISGNFQAGAGFRYIFEVFENQTIQCFRAVQRQMQSQFAVQLAQTAAAFQQQTAVFLTQELAGLRG